MCRSTAAPLMAMAGMAGTAVALAFAVVKEKADRRAIQREAEEEVAERSRNRANAPADETVDDKKPDDDTEPAS